jgi:hypothetical protein
MAVVTTAHPWGDPRVFERELATCLEWGLETHVFMAAPVPGHREGWSGSSRLVIHPLPRARGRLGRFAGALAAWRAVLRAGPFGLVQFHDPELLPAMAFLGLLCPDTYTLYDVHEDLALQVVSKGYLPPWSRPAVSRLASWLLRLARSCFSGFAPATEAIARDWPGERTRVVHNYPKALYGGPPVPLDRSRILYVGALTRDRGILTALEAMRLARREVEGLTLELVGRLEEPGVREAVLAAQGEGWCRHFPWMPAADLVRHAAGAGIGLVVLRPLPSYLESLPTKLFEYMAMGIPVLASDFPLWRGLVEDSGAGRVVRPEPEAMARALVEMIRDPRGLARHSEQGRLSYRRRYRWEVEALNLRWHLVRAGLLPPPSCTPHGP